MIGLILIVRITYETMASVGDAFVVSHVELGLLRPLDRGEGDSK